MKVESAHTPPSFQPITVTIQIESEEEFKAMNSFMKRDCSVPNYAHSNGWITAAQRDIISKMMNRINGALFKD